MRGSETSAGTSRTVFRRGKRCTFYSSSSSSSSAVSATGSDVNETPNFYLRRGLLSGAITSTPLARPSSLSSPRAQLLGPQGSKTASRKSGKTPHGSEGSPGALFVGFSLLAPKPGPRALKCCAYKA
ncbi:hypothetical protein MTO96_000701 [Rhipicephalus appendiculatus]